MSQASQIIDHGNRLFSSRGGLMFHFQELAELFYYERASFTVSKNSGDDFAAGIMSSTAALARREMGNMIRPMIRPAEFFSIGVEDQEFEGEERDWLEDAAKLMRYTMYDRKAGFTRSTVITDNDWLTFGQGVLELNMTIDRDALYFANHHLKDVAWSTDYMGNIEAIHRNCAPTISHLNTKFPGKLPAELQTRLEKEPHATVKARHVVAPVGLYDVGITGPHAFIAAWVLPEFDTMLEGITRPYKGYVIPRADVVTGSQYARSPFTGIVLPDARTKQAIDRVLLESGEKAVDPPMAAYKDAIQGDIGLYAGGITFLDVEYDERLGEALRPVNQDRSGLPIGMEMSMQYDSIIRQGLMLDKIALPDTSGMTAYQVRKVVEQQMRSSIPIFDPLELEYNEPLCAEVFDCMKFMGAFPANEIPEGLQGEEIEFQFKSPSKDLERESMPQQMMEGLQAIKVAAEVNPALIKMPDTEKMLGDTLRAIGWSEDWFADEDKFEKGKAALEDQMEQQAQTDEVAEAASISKDAAPMAQVMAGMEGNDNAKAA